MIFEKIPTVPTADELLDKAYSAQPGQNEGTDP